MGTERKLAEQSAHLARRQAALGDQLYWIEVSLRNLEVHDEVVDGISIRCPMAPDGDWLVTVRGRVGGEPCVFFVGAGSLFEALEALVKGLGKDERRWKSDHFRRD